jgi:hypothetical protein
MSALPHNLREALAQMVPADLWPEAPDDVWAIEHSDKVTLCRLRHFRSNLDQISREPDNQYRRNLILVAESLHEELSKRDVRGAIVRANRNRAATVKTARSYRDETQAIEWQAGEIGDLHRAMYEELASLADPVAQGEAA